MCGQGQSLQLQWVKFRCNTIVLAKSNNMQAEYSTASHQPDLGDMDAREAFGVAPKGSVSDAKMARQIRPLPPPVLDLWLKQPYRNWERGSRSDFHLAPHHEASDHGCFLDRSVCVCVLSAGVFSAAGGLIEVGVTVLVDFSTQHTHSCLARRECSRVAVGNAAAAIFDTIWLIAAFDFDAV